MNLKVTLYAKKANGTLHWFLFKMVFHSFSLFLHSLSLLTIVAVMALNLDKNTKQKLKSKLLNTIKCYKKILYINKNVQIQDKTYKFSFACCFLAKKSNKRLQNALLKSFYHFSISGKFLLQHLLLNIFVCIYNRYFGQLSIFYIWIFCT